MPLFVDHVGLNSLISEEIDTQNNIRQISNENRLANSYLDRCFLFPNSTDPEMHLYSNSVAGFPASGDLVFCFWVNMTEFQSSPNTRRTVFKANYDSVQDVIELYFSTNRFYFTVHQDTSNYKTWETPADIQGPSSDYKNEWRMITIKWDGDFSNAPSYFLDDDSGTTMTVSAGAASSDYWLDVNYIYIGDNSPINQLYELSGYLQNFCILNDTSISISSLYNNGKPRQNMSVVFSSSLLEWWKLGNETDFDSYEIGSSISIGTIISSSGGSVGTNLTSSNSDITIEEGLLSSDPPFRGNVLSDDYVGYLGDHKKLAALNTRRNGPYGFSTWKQLRVSENPITRRHKTNSTMTFVVQPGPVRNVLSNGELRVRDRYSALYSFTEPAIAQKAYPLVWNVGRHFKDENGNVDLENPERFSIISSYANQGIGFANNEVDKLHKFDPDEEKTEYREIYKLYAEGGLNDQKSPLTHWEFLQYRETVFPHMKNQFQNENLERPNFESFYRHNRLDRTKLYYDYDKFGFDPYVTDPPGSGADLSYGSYASTWPLDEEQHFLTRTYPHETSSIFWQPLSIEGPASIAITGARGSDGAYWGRYGEGYLMNTRNQFIKFQDSYNYLNLTSSNEADAISAASIYDSFMSPGPLYSRRISINDKASLRNPSGHICSHVDASGTPELFQGGALWEAGSTRQVKDTSGSWVSSPKTPFYDSYEAYVEEARRRYKNFSVVPEFRMSTQVEDYLTNNNAIELDMFDVTGGAENAQNSSQSQFYQIYSNSDFMRQFELINEDHKEFINGKVLSLRCKAIKKFLPYDGFYPAQRTVDLTKRFYDSFKNNISLFNGNGVQLQDFNFGRQLVMAPLFAPGVLFNTIKSGVAVDYPIITSSLNTYSTFGDYAISNSNFDKRIPFEAILDPKSHLANFNITSNEPHPSGNLSASSFWDGSGDELYSKMANNFLAEVPEFFLPNGQFSSIVSKKQKDISLVSGSVYGMRVKMRRSLRDTKRTVYHSGSENQSYLPPQDIVSGSSKVRESFTMYSRPSSFGPPSLGYIEDVNLTESTMHSFDDNTHEYFVGGIGYSQFRKYSVHGFNFPFTPPYYHGEAWCDITFTATSDNMTISEIQSTASYTYTRFDSSFYLFKSGSTEYTVDDFTTKVGPQCLADNRINKNAVQLSASLNLQGIGKVGKDGGGLGGAGGNLVVDSAVDEDSRWIIQTKFETPMFNFNHISHISGTLSLPQYGDHSVPIGMWHQYGRIPAEDEGVFLEVGPIEENWWRKARGETGPLKDLSAALGFSGQSTKIGRLRSSKKIYEAVVAVPFIESEGRKKFFRLNAAEVEAYKKGGEDRISLTNGDPQTQVGRSVLNQMQKMEKYIFPPSFDFLNYEEVDPIAMYIFEFSHTLSQQDLADIWQNLPPDIGTEMEESEVAITHPLLKKELLGEGGLQSGNTLIDMPNKLKWMVFKVKQRAASNYFKKTVLRNPEVNTDVGSGNVTVDEFGNTSAIQYNWPYDFFSLVELVKLDAEVEFGNFRDEDIANYTDSIPPYEAQTADMDKIEFIVGGMGDDIVADTQVPEEPNEEPSSTQERPLQRPPDSVATYWMQGYAERMMERSAITSYTQGYNALEYTYSTEESENYAFGSLDSRDASDLKRAVNNNSMSRPSNGWAQAIATEYGINLFVRDQDANPSMTLVGEVVGGASENDSAPWREQSYVNAKSYALDTWRNEINDELNEGEFPESWLMQSEGKKRRMARRARGKTKDKNNIKDLIKIYPNLENYINNLRKEDY